MERPTFYILPAEFVGNARVTDDVLDIGGVKVSFRGHIDGEGRFASVYVRRASNDLSVMEIHIARHDGLAQEQLDQQNDEAANHPLGAKEYWRSEMVGKCTYNGHPMTDEEFETDWEESEGMER